MNTIVYYVPSIPDVWSTARYQHALAVIEAADKSILIGNADPPSSLARKATEVHNTDSESVIERAHTAARIAKDSLDQAGVFVTSFHYEATLSGVLAKRSDITWITDIFDAPAQYRFNNPKSHHTIASHGLEWMLGKADRSIHTCHPKTPFQYGQDRHFITNGSPISQIDPLYGTEDEVSIVWAGSPRSDRGGALLTEALSRTDERIQVHIYGEADDRIVSLAKQHGVADQFNFYGWVTHDEVLSAIRRSTIGFAVLPPRKDWIYAPAIKIGEYLAGGTIPIMSDYPGSRYVAADAGTYVQPDVESVAEAITTVCDLSCESRLQWIKNARNRGEEVSWESVRSSFATLLSQ